MDNYVIDTSVWIDFFNKKKSKNIDKVFELMDTPKNLIVILPVILQEVLQGIKDDAEYDIISSIVFGFQFINFDAYEFSLHAAELYRRVQKKGITIRKANDCLIASLCIKNGYILIHNDRDFDNIAKYTSLKIYK
jgi:predicted nucleic acid-binding protein